MSLTVTTDRALFRQTIITWLSTYAGIAKAKIIWADQSTPRPAKPYATIYFPTGFVKTGFDEERRDFNDYEEVIERLTGGPRTITAQVEVYTDPAPSANADEAQELLENALLALDTSAVQELFRAAKIGYFGYTAPMRLDDQFGDRWERRSHSDVTFVYSGEIFDDGDGTGNWIETVEVPTEGNGHATYNE